MVYKRPKCASRRKGRERYQPMKPAAFALLISVVAYDPLAHAQIPHIVGNWELNAEATFAATGIREEDLPESGIYSDSRTYYLRDDGYLIGLAVTVLSDGTVNFLQFAARSDGEDYPEYDSATLAEYQATGKATRATYSERRIDEYTVEVTDKVDGRITAHGTRTVSEDGSTMSLDLDAMGPDGIAWKVLYDRR
jgi:hypothetical protein